MKTVEVRVPDIGDFRDVEVIELMVGAGEKIARDQSLVLVESDKASMEIPSPQAGIVREMKVKLGDRISEGSLLLLLDVEDAGKTTTVSANMATEKVMSIECDTLVLGAGPGGYTAAFRAADLGQKVVLVERYPVLGGVCLNVGCIPSKALLHAAGVITGAQEMAACGIRFGKPEIDIAELRQWKQRVVAQLTEGLSGLAAARKITVLHGIGTFSGAHGMTVSGSQGKWQVKFSNAIIAAGSSAVKLPGLPYGHPALVDSTGALRLDDIPRRMLVIGGGIIGLEMACVYDALGSRVTVVELSDDLIPSADPDMVRPLLERIGKRYDAILTNTRVAKLEASGTRLKATFQGKNAPAEPQVFDRVLVAVGRMPNGRTIGAEAAGVEVDDRGFIAVNRRQQTNVPHIYAIGDICGEPMLAHKASYEGRVAAEAIAGLKTECDAMTVPSVAYTDPEVAWMGLTEREARSRGIDYEKSVFPWSASGRALTMGRQDGRTKLLWDKTTGRLLGAAVTGVHAGELLSEMTLALEMGADLDDIALTIHPHPTLSETVMMAAKAGLGTITDLFIPKRKGG